MYVFGYYVEQVFGIVAMGRFAGAQGQVGVRGRYQAHSGFLIKGKEFDGMLYFVFFELYTFDLSLLLFY